MKFQLLMLLMLATVAGCSKMVESRGPAAQLREMPATASSRHLAYEHVVQIDASEDKISTIYEAGQTACRKASADLCTVLASQTDSGRDASALLKFRAKPSGIRKLIAALSVHAEVTKQSTTAEDLESPIEDAAKKLALLKDYRTSLEALRSRASNDIDALIKVSRELAQVQSELEAATGKHGRLMQRVDTEILTVSIRATHNQSFWRPIALAVSDFGGNLSQGVSVAITGIAFLLPWAILLFLFVWGCRTMWRRRKQSPTKD